MSLTLVLLNFFLLFGAATSFWYVGRRKENETGVLCRIKHYKTLLDEKNKVIGCQKSCPTNFEERYSFSRGHYCKQLYIPEGCSSQYCLRCTSGYKRMYTYPYEQRCVKECPLGYTDIAGICIACITQNCKECDSMWQCTKCDSGFAMYTTVWNSTLCVRKCSRRYMKVYLNETLTCVKRNLTENVSLSTETTVMTTTTKVVTETSPAENRSILKVSPKGCNDENCINCQHGFYKYYPLTKGSLCLAECPTGYTTFGDVCIACADRRCASCKTSASECDKCFQGYLMVLDPRNTTLECVQTCPDGYKQHIVNLTKVCLKTPEPECPLANCARCVSEKLHGFHKGCAQCSTGYTLFRDSFRDHCYVDCPSGFFKSNKPGTNITVCEKCETPFCNVCTSKTKCIGCVEPMVLDETTSRCKSCPPLKEFNFNTKTCVMSNLNVPETNEAFG